MLTKREEKASYSQSQGPSHILSCMDLRPSLPTSTCFQKVFLHPEPSLSSLAVQHPWVEPQALGLALEAPVTWLQSVYKVYILQPTHTPKSHQVCPFLTTISFPKTKVSYMVVSHVYMANPRHQGSGEHPWWVRLCLLSHVVAGRIKCYP